MGPLASAHFMMRLTLLTPADRDQDHVPAVLWSDPRVPDRTAPVLTGDADPLPWLQRGVAGLIAAGCGAIVMPCNTAHGWYEPLRDAAAPRPMLHIVDAAAAALRQADVPSGPVGLMGTAATLRMRLYQDRLAPLGWECLVPDEAAMAALVTPAIRLVKLNRVAEAAPPLLEAARALIARGARAVVLGCTEIPVALDAHAAATLDAPVIDATDALALAAIAWARG